MCSIDLATSVRRSAGLALCAFALALACARSERVLAQGAESPDPAPIARNVVLIVVDDLGWMDLGVQGSRYYSTPSIDTLARDGLLFTNGYAACAVCSPTRAAVLTGRYPAHIGVTDWIRSRFQRGGIDTPDSNPSEWVSGPDGKLLCPPNPYWMDLEEITIAEVLDPAFRTAHIGKWHLGDDAWYPERQGFHENHGGCDYGQPPSYFDPYTNPRLPEGIPTLAPRLEGEYLTDREGDEAATFIAANRDRRFFLHLAPYAVHTPIQAPKELVDEWRAKEPTHQKNAAYAAMVERVDAAVGKVLDALDEHGLAESTLVIFTSDNGGLLGPTDNRPLRSGKGYPYEGGIRVPAIVRWPGVIPAGSVSNEPISSIDWYPTIVDATGVSPPKKEVDGRSLVEHLRRGGKTSLGRSALYWHFPHYRQGREVPPYSIIRRGDWKLIRWHEGPTFELYHLRDDPSERRDLAPSLPYLVAELDAQLLGHLVSVGAKIPRRNPELAHRSASGKSTESTDGSGDGSGDGTASSLPRVLLLGDSISIGYTPTVKELLEGEAIVERPMLDAGRPENCDGTTNGLKRLDAWLGDTKWDVIHFNFGLHDLKRVHPETGVPTNDPAHPRQATPETYRRQLREIIERLQATGAELVLATTTPVPEGKVSPHRDPDDPPHYNAIALDLAREAGIAVNDLYTFAKECLPTIGRPRNVHFTDDGSRRLAERVAESVRLALARRK